MYSDANENFFEIASEETEKKLIRKTGEIKS